MKPYDYIKITLAIAGIVCLYLIALSNRYDVMDENGYTVFDKWACCMKYIDVDKDGFYIYKAEQEDMSVKETFKSDTIITKNDNLKKLYDVVNERYNAGDFETFKKKMENPGARRKVYDSVNTYYDLKDYDTFESFLGY